MLQQYALDNQRDILAASKGDTAAVKRVQARLEAATMVAVTAGGGLAVTAGGLTILGAAPEIVLAARLIIAGCKTNPALCVNQAGIYAVDIIAPEAIIGTGPIVAGTTLVVGKTIDSTKKLAQQATNTAAIKNMAFNVQPVTEIVNKEIAGFSLSAKTISSLNDATKNVKEATFSRVGRWMSPAEFNKMQLTGKVVQGGGGQTFVSTNGVLDYKRAASPGSIYVEFDVPTSSLLKGGKDGWFKLIGPDANASQQLLLNKQGGTQSPDVKNIVILDKK